MNRILRKHLSRAAGSLPHFVLLGLAAGAMCLPVRAAHAGATPEQACQNGRYAAAAKYHACQRQLFGKFFGGAIQDYDGKFLPALAKCRDKYTATWVKLAAKAAGTGSTCDAPRFTDNGTTVTDNLTGLRWEKKTADLTIHDKDNGYSWSASAGGSTAADGTAFTVFLPALNGGGCFAGRCDWRLPTIYELQTILPEAYPCTTSACSAPIFGPTVANHYWSATTSATSPNGVWSVDFSNRKVIYGDTEYFSFTTIAVSGGE